MKAPAAIAARLQDIFGGRLQMAATFGSRPDVCAVVDSLTVEDLDKCAIAFGKQNPPLLIGREELSRGMDAFPLEFSDIIASRQMITGRDLFADITIPLDDVRRACEVQARSHLLHLREAYVQAGGDRNAIDALVSASVEPFRALLASVARLDGASAEDMARRFGAPATDFPSALAAASRLVEYVDTWTRA